MWESLVKENGEFIRPQHMGVKRFFKEPLTTQSFLPKD